MVQSCFVTSRFVINHPYFRCLSLLPPSLSIQVLKNVNPRVLYYTDDGSNATRLKITISNETLKKLQSDHGTTDPSKVASLATTALTGYGYHHGAATPSQLRDRGLHAYDLDLDNPTCLVNLTNGTSGLALDLSKRHLYVASLQKAGGHYSILRIPVDVSTPDLVTKHWHNILNVYFPARVLSCAAI